jgi:hypothetical protein
VDEKLTLGFLVPETVFVILCDYEIGISCLEVQQDAAKAETMIFSQKMKAVNYKKSNYFKK